LLERALQAAADHVTIDARDLTFIDAHALGALIAANTRTGVSVRHARPNCRRVFELCALDPLLDDGPSRPCPPAPR
jgi:anti-anti-sigma regulatory factor